MRMNEAVAAKDAGDLARARMLYREALRMDPRQADALHMLGLLAQQSGDLPSARTLMEESVAIRPTVALVHFNLANVRDLQGDFAGAILAYEAAVVVAPGCAEAHSNLGNLYGQVGRRDDALRAYAEAIRAKPDFAPVYSNLAVVLIDLGRFDEAIRALETALRLAPDIPEAHLNLGQAYRRSGRFREAIDATRRAIELRPDYRDAYLNLALAAFEIEEFDVSIDANRRALELDATSPQTHFNLAMVYHLAGRYAEAIATYRSAIALWPDFVEAHANLAFSLLVSGDFARGWEEYVWIWRLPAKRADYPYLDRATLWNGETFAGRQLLITRDQGFGDAIQMVRYLPAVKALGGRVVLEVLPALLTLFEGFAGIDELRVVGDVAMFRDDVDLYIPLTVLPRALRTDVASIPAPIPYLRASDERVERWRARIESSARLRVGIVWAGFPGNVDDRHRSVRLEDFAALGTIDGITWFGLQKGRDEECPSCGPLILDPLGAEIKDFADTAAVLAHLDLVISIDTAIVHLAGAMGKPVWTLLPFVPDWRWMTGRRDSPWYPTMRLFRQPRAGDWASVFGEVAHELSALRS
jgi:tetratricopeptide (TPR) repeat protein